MAGAGRQHIIVRLRLLQDHPHAIDVVARMAPVTAGIEIADKELILQARLDGRDRAGNLARDKGFAADRTLMVEQNSV
jgi:hypothetical protein